MRTSQIVLGDNLRGQAEPIALTLDLELVKGASLKNGTTEGGGQSVEGHAPKSHHSEAAAKTKAESRPCRGVALELAASLEASWSGYRRRLKRCQRGMSEEDVHQLRVATRRLLSGISLLESLGIIERKDAQDVQRVLKKRLKALGDVRDAHVLRISIENKLELFPELVLLKSKLAKRERKLIKAAAPEVRDWGTGKLERHIEATRRNLVRAAGSRRSDDRLSRCSSDAITAAFTKLVACRGSIDPRQPATVHRTRLAFKRFRYTVELLSPCVTGFTATELSKIARYQRRMGRIQDYEVLQRYVEEYVSEHRGSAPALLGRFLTYLQKRRGRLLKDFLAKADELHGFWRPQPIRHTTRNRKK